MSCIAVKLLMVSLAWAKKVLRQDYTISIVPATSMVFNSATAFQNNLTEVQIAQTDVEVLGIAIQTNGSLNPFNLTSVTFNANGTTAFATDVTGVKVYYTGGSPVFSNTTLFGSAANLSAPVTGSKVRPTGMKAVKPPPRSWSPPK